MSYGCDYALPSQWPDRLRSGIWPQSLGLWLSAFWIMLFIIRPWEKLIPELGALHVERFYALTVIAAVVCQGQLRFRSSSQTTGVLLFLSALTLSWLVAYDQSAAWGEYYKYATLVVFYFVLTSVIRTPYQLLFITACYIATMGAYLGKSQWEYFVNGGVRYTMGVHRLLGIENTFSGPNSVAASTVLSLPLLYVLWRHRAWLTQTWPVLWRTWFPRCLVMYFLLATSSIILTNSRSGMLGFVLFVYLAAFARRKRGGKLIALVAPVILLGAIWAVMPEENKNRLRTVWDPSIGPANAQDSAMGRIEGMKVGLEMFRQQPITGAGIGCFVPYRLAHIDNTPAQAHSLIGQLLGEMGMMGAGAFLLLLVPLFTNCRRTKRLAKRGADPTMEMLSDLSTACRNAVILLLFFGLFGHNLYRFNWLWLAAFALLSCRFAEDLFDDDQHPRFVEGMVRPGITI